MNKHKITKNDAIQCQHGRSIGFKCSCGKEFESDMNSTAFLKAEAHVHAKELLEEQINE